MALRACRGREPRAARAGFLRRGVLDETTRPSGELPAAFTGLLFPALAGPPRAIPAALRAVLPAPALRPLDHRRSALRAGDESRRAGRRALARGPHAAGLRAPASASSFASAA